MKPIVLIGIVVVIILIVVLYKIYQRRQEKQERQKQKVQQDIALQERSELYKQLLGLALVKRKQKKLEEEKETTAGDWITMITHIGDAVMAVWLGIDTRSGELSEIVFEADH